MNNLVGLIFLIFTTYPCLECARILGVFHIPSYSHYTLGETLMKALAKRGHQVTMISAYSQNTPVENYRDITIGSESYFQDLEDSTNLTTLLNCPDLLMPIGIGKLGARLAEAVFKHEKVQDLLNSKSESFDLVIKEEFLNEAHHGFAYHFKAPMIVTSTMGATIWVNHLVGNSALPSISPNLFLTYSSTMSFRQRVYNTLYTTYQYLVNLCLTFPQQDDILHKFFPEAPNLYQLMANTSLVFLNSHPSCKSPTSLVPNMIEIGGFHIGEVKPLPAELQKFLDSANEGVVYFSFGSRLRTSDLPEAKIRLILNVFARLPMKVLWKFEGKDINNLSPNVILQKWLPQQSILAHPNLKIFISHGGMLSILESVHFGVPILGIPLQADQESNMAETAEMGFGMMIAYDNLTEDNLYEALTDMIQNKKCEENVKRRSKIMQDRILKPLDEAIYWTEYVINHKGAHHLKSTAMKLTWYQQYLFDVFAFLMVCVIFSVYVIYVCIKSLNKITLCSRVNIKHKVT